MRKTDWWMTDTYDRDLLVPMELAAPDLWGPTGMGLVPLFPTGNTAPGWGLRGADGKPGFMEKYSRREFSQRRVLHGVELGAWHYAWIMRSGRVVCIDIDGKNGGFENAIDLGVLPPTTAETSKSGNGYHLFYRVEDEWDDAVGFAKYVDLIGFVPGVDIRATGCVYHYPQQRWNDRPLADLPVYLEGKMLAKAQHRIANDARIQKVLEGDPEDLIIMYEDLKKELRKPIPVGKRNPTLFAIGTDMHKAGVPGWEELIYDKGIALGLDDAEASKIVENVKKYA